MPLRILQSTPVTIDSAVSEETIRSILAVRSVTRGVRMLLGPLVQGSMLNQELPFLSWRFDLFPPFMIGQQTLRSFLCDVLLQVCRRFDGHPSANPVFASLSLLIKDLFCPSCPAICDARNHALQTLIHSQKNLHIALYISWRPLLVQLTELVLMTRLFRTSSTMSFRPDSSGQMIRQVLQYVDLESVFPWPAFNVLTTKFYHRQATSSKFSWVLRDIKRCESGRRKTQALLSVALAPEFRTLVSACDIEAFFELLSMLFSFHNSDEQSTIRVLQMAFKVLWQNLYFDYPSLHSGAPEHQSRTSMSSKIVRFFLSERMPWMFQSMMSAFLFAFWMDNPDRYPGQVLKHFLFDLLSDDSSLHLLSVFTVPHVLPVFLTQEQSADMDAAVVSADVDLHDDGIDDASEELDPPFSKAHLENWVMANTCHIASTLIKNRLESSYKDVVSAKIAALFHTSGWEWPSSNGRRRGLHAFSIPNVHLWLTLLSSFPSLVAILVDLLRFRLTVPAEKEVNATVAEIFCALLISSFPRPPNVAPSEDALHILQRDLLAIFSSSVPQLDPELVGVRSDRVVLLQSRNLKLGSSLAIG